MAVLASSLLSSLRFKDCLLIGLCFLFTYLLRIRDSVILEPVFEIPIDVSLYPNGKYFEGHRVLPQPIVTDLDGDRRNEIVVIDNDFKIKIIRAEKEGSSETDGQGPSAHRLDADRDCYENLRRLKPQSEAPLPQDYAETGVQSHPVAMATGTGVFFLGHF